MSARPDALYDLDAARGEAQRRRMEEFEAGGICVFCAEHRETHQPEPIEHVGEHWWITRNAFPYAGTVAHYLIVAQLHVCSFDELPDEAGAELWALRRMLKQRLTPLATAAVERSGDMRLNGGSVAHLHTHFVALAPEPAATVRFRVSARGPDDA